jgi:hypothetical protein
MIKPAHHLCSLLLVTIACQPSSAVGGQPGKNKSPLLAEAEHQYTLTRVNQSRDVTGISIGTGTPVEDITVYSFEMHKNNPSPEKHHWVGAFYASEPYPGLGFGQGMNYVFLLASGDESHRYVVVPSQKGMTPHFLVYDPKVDLTQGRIDPPLAIRSKVSKGSGHPLIDGYQIGGCVEGPCDSGHCSAIGVGEEYSGT